MSREKPKWIRNEVDNGDRPICPYCNKDYGDGHIFDVKNYPADGGAIMFLNCEDCDKEAEIYFEWKQLQKIGEDIVYLKK